jgi:hypothetical protein
MGGLSHGWSDLMHGNVGGAIGDVAGGVAGAAGDIAHGQIDAMGHLGGGIAAAGGDIAHGGAAAAGDLGHGVGSLVSGVLPAAKTGWGVFSKAKSAWDIFHGNGQPGQTKADGAASGLGAINQLLGFGSSSKKPNEKDEVDKDLDTGKSVVGAAKTAISVPGKIVDLAEKAASGKLPGAGLVEKLTGGALKEGMLAEKASKVLGPVSGFIESKGAKLLEGPLGKFIEKEGVAAAGGVAGKIAGKLVPGLNIAMAGISALQSGKDAAERWQKGDKLGAAIEGLHTVTNLAGAVPGVGGLISAGGDLVAGAAHWLADGGAKKLGDLAGGAASAVGGAAKAVGGAVSGAVGGAVNMAGKVASSVGGAIGGAAKSVGGAIGGAAKKIFSGW